MTELNFEEIEDVSGGIVPLVAAALGVLAAYEAGKVVGDMIGHLR